MWTFSNIQSLNFLFLLGITVFCSFFWVTYSLQEFLIFFRKSLKNHTLYHEKELESYREKLKRRE